LGGGGSAPLGAGTRPEGPAGVPHPPAGPLSPPGLSRLTAPPPSAPASSIIRCGPLIIPLSLSMGPLSCGTRIRCCYIPTPLCAPHGSVRVLPRGILGIQKSWFRRCGSRCDIQGGGRGGGASPTGNGGPPVGFPPMSPPRIPFPSMRPRLLSAQLPTRRTHGVVTNLLAMCRGHRGDEASGVPKNIWGLADSIQLSAGAGPNIENSFKDPKNSFPK